MKPIVGNGNPEIRLQSVPVAPSEAYLAAAESLLTGIGPLLAALPDTTWPLAFLAGQILECTLKAYLAARGVPESELRSRKLRHNLLQLWSRAIDEHLPYEAGQPAWLQRLGELHDRFVLRYPMGVNGIVLPECAAMARELPKLIDAVRRSSR